MTAEVPRMYPDSERVLRKERRSPRSQLYRFESNKALFKAWMLCAAMAAALMYQSYRADERVKALQAEHVRELATCRAKLGMVTPRKDPGHCESYFVPFDGMSVVHCHRTVTRM